EQKSATELVEKYNKFIADADAKLAAKNYAEAINAYQNASNVMPNEDYPKKKIQEIQDLVEAEAIQKQKEKQEEQYNAFMVKADEAFSAKKYEDALTSYKEAQKVKNSEDVKAKITATQAKIDELNKEGEEQRVQAQYDEFMKKAKEFEKNKDLQLAIDNYKLASRLKENEQEPKDKIASLTEELKKQEEQAQIENRYKQAMTSGHTAFEKGEYNEAIKFFNTALEIKKDEKEPKDMIAKSEEKLKEISSKDEDIQFEKMLQFAQQKIDEKDYEKAMELIVRAESNRPNDKRLLEMKKKVQEILVREEEYKAQIVTADELANAQDYKKAIDAYKKASKLKPEESYPTNRIAEIESIIASSSKQGQAEKQYEELLAKAKELIAKNELEQALSTVTEAVNVLPKDKRALDLVKQIQNLIAENNKKKQDESLETQYASLLAKADNLFNAKKWSEAKMAYEKAQVIKAKEPYLAEQIQKCTANLAENDLRRSKYLAILATADLEFKNRNLEKAKSSYELALTYDNQEYPNAQIKKINSLLAQRSKGNGDKLEALGEEIDNSLMDGAALLARAEEYRKTAKGELVKIERNKATEHTDSVVANRKNLIESNVDTLKKTHGILIEGLAEYYDNQFDKDKQIKEIDNSQTELMIQWSDFNYSDNVDNKRKMGIHQEIRLDRESQFIDHNNEFSDSVKFIRQDLEHRNEVYTNSDYDFIMADKNTLHETKEIIVQQKVDTDGKHDVVVDLVKSENKKAVDEYNRQDNVHADKIDNVVNVLDDTDEKDRNRTHFFEKGHEDLSEAVKGARDFAIDEENKNFNNTYTKQMKARVEVKKEEERTVLANKEYHENKSLDIDKSRERLNQTSLKYNSDDKNDDLQREDARLFMKGTEQKTVTQNFEQEKKKEVKVDNVKGVAHKEQTIQNVANTDKKDALYDTRSELKTLEVSKVQYPAKVANQIGKGVSQETFQQKGPDGLPVAIVTRRIVVTNGFGNVYTRTQKYGSITYSKNGEVCTEQIWRNETTDPKLEKHY
ncbi:MAG TPA: hypothetical protein PLP27_05870, partial [Crocinitomicaceae bacterium]|nr:hypothetical protein [Crocinitomicaceae bacterium]